MEKWGGVYRCVAHRAVCGCMLTKWHTSALPQNHAACSLHEVAAKRKSTGNPIGRPPRAGSRMEKTLRVRLSAEEWSQLEHASEESGEDMSELARESMYAVGILKRTG